MIRPHALPFAALLALGACDDDGSATAPPPVAMTAEAVAEFCRMSLAEMPGPKAQVHLDGMPDPIFFAQVRDAVAYLKSPEKRAEIAAIYVSDMGAALSWEAPGRDNWTDARSARFVVGADLRGGMGAPEIAPFATQADAEAFAARHGGEVMALDAIPAEAALGPVEIVLEEVTR